MLINEFAEIGAAALQKWHRQVSRQNVV
jgi:hypothetical protein